MARDKILIVDDDIKLLGSLKNGLQKFGQFDILTAVHGVQALAILKTARPAIMVTDLQMPRMDGVELLSIVTRDFPNILCIVTTELKDHALRKKFQGGSLFSYVSKEVPRLTEGMQHPYSRIQGTDLPLFVVDEDVMEEWEDGEGKETV